MKLHNTQTRGNTIAEVSLFDWSPEDLAEFGLPADYKQGEVTVSFQGLNFTHEVSFGSLEEAQVYLDDPTPRYAGRCKHHSRGWATYNLTENEIYAFGITPVRLSLLKVGSSMRIPSSSSTAAQTIFRFW